MAAAGAWIGSLFAGLPGYNPETLLTALSVAMVCAAGNAFNDYVDIESDRINHPDRPLPRGDLPARSGLLASMSFAWVALGFAVVVNWLILIVVAVSLTFLILYSLYLKRIPLLGNMAVSLLGGATFLTGGLVGGVGCLAMLPGPVIPAALAVPLHFARELIKDSADCEGDRRAGFKTLPLLVSGGTFLFLISVLFVIVIVFSLLPVYFDWFGFIYAIVAIAAVDIPLVTLLYYLWFSKSEKRYRLAGNLLKILMVLGLIALLTSGL
jgi:geranylgeranylglycerol-phosphate geranylgeranyltransferase